jgi:hypothetical protein
MVGLLLNATASLGRRCGLTEVPSQYLRGSTEENHKKLKKIVDDRFEIRTYHLLNAGKNVVCVK